MDSEEPCYIDSHTHLLDYPTGEIIEQIIKYAQSKGIQHVIVNTTSSKQYASLLELYQKHPGWIVPGFGVHPYFVSIQRELEGQQSNSQSWIEQLQAILKGNRLYTVGEIGLDYRKIVQVENTKEMQMEYFEKQINLAILMERPVTVHCVLAHREMLKYLKKVDQTFNKDKAPLHVVMHSYAGSREDVKLLLKLRNLIVFFSLSLNRSPRLCSSIPLDRLICETDSPCQNNIQLLAQVGLLQDNKYRCFIEQSLTQQLQPQATENKAQQQALDFKLLKSQPEKISCQALAKQTNQPANIIANIRHLCPYYNIEEKKLIKIVFNNTLKAFKLLK